MARIKRVQKIIFTLIALVVCILSANYLYNLFSLKSVSLIGQNKKLEGLSILNNSNLLTIDTTNISQYLLRQNPQIKLINIIKKYPHELTIYTEDRIPIARIKTNSGVIFLDIEGVLLNGSYNMEMLPEIKTDAIAVHTGQKVDWRLMKALIFIQELTKQRIIIEQINVNDQSGTFNTRISQGTEIVFSYDSDIYEKASSLQVIILRFRIEGKNIAKIDFRFDKPLVTLTGGEKISSTF